MQLRFTFHAVTYNKLVERDKENGAYDLTALSLEVQRKHQHISQAQRQWARLVIKLAYSPCEIYASSY